jgi:hypothetical protein
MWRYTSAPPFMTWYLIKHRDKFTLNFEEKQRFKKLEAVLLSFDSRQVYMNTSTAEIHE